MILTCPACSTKYVVKDGAIPPGGRQVRCASCKHSWHQDPEIAAGPDAGIAEAERDYSASIDAPFAEAPMESIPPAVQPFEAAPEEYPFEASLGDVPPEADHVGDSDPASPPERDAWRPPAEREAMAMEVPAPSEAPAETSDDFEPFYDYEPVDKPKRGLPLLLLVLAVVAILAALFWFLAPAEIKQRIGIADAGAANTPLEVMVTNSDRQKLASGNELFAVSGRVINPTDENQRVPPLRAELLDASQTKVIYSWTIAPPATTLAPGRSASFNSAEVDVPQGGSHLRVTLGGPAA